METKEKVWLSASKIDKFNDCSYLYYTRYILKIPDEGNDGSRRGSVVHEVLEPLLNPRHKKHFDQIIKYGSVTGCVPVFKLMKKLATKYQVCDVKNLEMINDFIMVALRHEFFGPAETIKIIGEKEFNIEIDQDGKRYKIRGFIDKTFIIQGQKGLVIRVQDYKSSKAKYASDKLVDNIQSTIYQLALKHLYPDINIREFSFLFLKFNTKPEQKQPSFDDNHLGGFEWYLTEVQDKIENFTQKNALDNLAILNKEKSWLCGKEGLKKDGSKSFICAARKPFYYYVVIDGEKIIETDFKEENLKKTGKNLKIEKRYYSGCAFFFNEKGKPRNFE